MYQKLNDKIPTEPNHAMSELVPQALGHLTTDDVEFFNKWSKMSSLESGEARKGSKLKNLWCMTPSQRELQGQAITDLVSSNNCGEVGGVHAFKKNNGQTLLSIFQPGDMVIVSSIKGELALAQGTVSHASQNVIELKLDKDLKQRGSQLVTYVIDKFEYALSSSNWLTLAKLMSNTDQAKMLRDIVITNKVATFVSGLPKQVAITGKHILKPLNRVQQKAIFKTMMAEEFVLLKGMPGSGKTTMTGLF